MAVFQKNEKKLIIHNTLTMKEIDINLEQKTNFFKKLVNCKKRTH